MVVMTEPSNVEAADMSRFWRLVAAQHGRVSGYWWVTRPDKKGRSHVQSVDIEIWCGPDDDPRSWGRTAKTGEISCYVDSGGVVDRLYFSPEIEAEAEDARADIIAVMITAAEIVEWGESS